jgi:deoxyribodipyrimidine photolyase
MGLAEGCSMNILWFRRDLRLADNESLSRACSNTALSSYVKYKDFPERLIQ